MNLRATLILLLILCAAKMSVAIDYRQVTTGLYSNPNTWQGGVLPPATIASNDRVILSAGDTLRLDSNIVFLPHSRLEFTYNTVLETVGINTITMYGKSELWGDATSRISVYKMVFLNSGVTNNFLGRLKAAQLEVGGWNFESAFELTVTNSFRLIDSIVRFNTTTVSFDTIGAQKATIIFDGGELLVEPSAIFAVGDRYNVRYTSSTYSEINDAATMGPGLYNFELYIPLFDSLIIGSFEFDGTLTLGSGMLNVKKGSTVTMGVDGHLNNINGFMNLDECNLVVNSKQGNAGILKMLPGKVLDTLDMSGSLNTVLKLGNHLTVSEFLNLNIGKIDCNYSDLYIPENCIINRNSNDRSYIIAEDYNPLTAAYDAVLLGVAPNTTRLAPIGTSSSIQPIEIQNNNNYALNKVKLRVQPFVLTLGHGGVVITQKPLVTACWRVEGDTYPFSISPHWVASDEVHKFNRDFCSIFSWHNNDNEWKSNGYGAARSSSGFYATPFLELGTNWVVFYFVGDQNSLSVNELSKQEIHLTIHPNPVTDILRLNYRGRVSIYNMQGQMVVNEEVEQLIHVGALPAGVYQLQTEDGHWSRFTKQ